MLSEFEIRAKNRLNVLSEGIVFRPHICWSLGDDLRCSRNPTTNLFVEQVLHADGPPHGPGMVSRASVPAGVDYGGQELLYTGQGFKFIESRAQEGIAALGQLP